MSKISEVLNAAPRQFSMHQELQNAGNLITAARTKLVSAKSAAAADLDAAAGKLIRIILTLDPKFDLGISPNFSAETKCAEGAADSRVEELLAKIRELEGVVDVRNAEVADLQGRLREALAVTTTAAAVVADEAAPMSPDAPAPKKPKGAKPRRISDEPEAVQPEAVEPKTEEPA